MINKLFNWVGGGFFRTLGRFLAFIALGFIASVIISKNDIKLTDLLGIETVKASENNLVYNITNAQWSTVYNSGYSNMALGDDRLWTANGSFNSNQRFYMKTNVINIPNSTDYIQVNIKFRPNNTDTIVFDPFYCYLNAEGQLPQPSNFHYTGFQCGIGSTIEADINEVRWGLTLTYAYNSEMDQSPCYAVTSVGDTFTFQCPVPNTLNTVYGFVIRAHSNQAMTFQGGVDQKIAVKLDSSSQIIENQNQNTNQTISTITDSNTTEATSEANNFFSGFTTQDNGGISSIITAPLSAISGLVSSTCSPIVLPIPYLDNKQIILPCMSSIYQEHFGQLFTLYQTIIFGLISYRMLISIFSMIQGFKNPDDDRIEVFDL